MVKIRSSEITPEHVYVSRRKFMKGIGAVALTSLALSACGPLASVSPTPETNTAANNASGANAAATAGPNVTAASPTAKPAMPADTPTSLDDITHYNNYYEFSQAKEPVAELAKDFK